MAKKQKADPAEDQVEVSEDQEESQSGEEQDVAGEDAPEEAAEDQVEVKPTPIVDVHERLEKAVASMHSSGDAHTVHVLNKVQHLTGSLKHSLPAAIAVMTDEDLKAGLQALLSLL
jgi:hypothetical protein